MLRRLSTISSSESVLSSETLETLPLEFQYDSISIQKKEECFLGVGSYGSVYKAQVDELLCAAKVLHITHPNESTPVAQKIIKKIEMECNLLSQIRHPNIVQYLGMCKDPDTSLPVMLMELADTNLTKYLERSNTSLPFHMQLNFVHDIAQALAYLHRCGITHHSLTSNNVVLIADSRAKVTDFGMNKLVDVSLGRPHSFRHVTEVYMAPELLRTSISYSEKVDCFSLGVLIIQVLTQMFPDPGPRTILVSDPLSPTGMSERPVLEVQRRQPHISKIKSTDPLLTVAIECLNYSADDRPSASQLCSHLTNLKQTPQYCESLDFYSRQQLQHSIQLRDGSARLSPTLPQFEEATLEIKTLRQKVEYLQRQLHVQEQQLLAKDGELAHLSKNKVGIDDTKSSSDVILDSNLHASLLQRKKEIENLRSSLSRRDSEIFRIQKQLEMMAVKDPHSKQSKSASTSTESSVKRSSIETHKFSMEWTCGPKAPRKMALGSVAVDGSTVYFRPSLSGNVYAFDTNTSKWDELPPCPCYDFAIVVAGGLLTTVGGNQANGATNTLLSLITSDDREKQTWENYYPPMKTERSNCVAVSSGKVLIVVGGYSRPVDLNTVDVLDTEDKQWFTASSLPVPLSNSSATIYNDSLFVVEGWKMGKLPSKNMYRCSVKDLVYFARNGFSSHNRSLWEKVGELPEYNATCSTVCGRLLMFGGLSADNHATNSVYVFDTFKKCFEPFVEGCPTARYCCLVAQLPGNQVMLVGGYTDEDTTDVVEIGTLQLV